MLYFPSIWSFVFYITITTGPEARVRLGLSRGGIDRGGDIHLIKKPFISMQLEIKLHCYTVWEMGGNQNIVQ